MACTVAHLQQKGSKLHTRTESAQYHMAHIFINTTKYHAAKSAPVSAVSVCVARTTHVELRWVRKAGRRENLFDLSPKDISKRMYIKRTMY